MSDKCPVCGNNAEIEPLRVDAYDIFCVRCGNYNIDGLLKATLDNATKVPIENIIAVSGFLRENPQYKLNNTNYYKIAKETKIPSVRWKTEKLLLLFEKHTMYPGAYVSFDQEGKMLYGFWGKCFIRDYEEWKFLVFRILKDEKGFISNTSASNMRVTPVGYTEIEILKSIQGTSDNAFIAMWFNDDVKSTREIIKEAINNAGYEPKIVDEVEHNDDVTDKIVTLINRSRFVIADFTGQRAGVYYEAGYARGLNIPVIHTVRNDEIKKLHFDINHQNFIAWNAEKLEEFKKELTNRITATIGDGPIM